MHIEPVVSHAQFLAVDDLYQQTFGEASVPTIVQQGWWQHWPAGMAALMDQDKVVGGLSCWPVKQHVYASLCAGLQQERNIAPEDIDSSTPQYFHLSEIVILAAFRHRIHTAMLVQHMLLQLSQNLEKRGTLYLTAYAYSHQGSRLMQYMGMEPLLPASATADGQSLWHLSISSPEQLAGISKAFTSS